MTSIHPWLCHPTISIKYILKGHYQDLVCDSFSIVLKWLWLQVGERVKLLLEGVRDDCQKHPVMTWQVVKGQWFKASFKKWDSCSKAELPINKITFIYITSHSCTIHLSLIATTESMSYPCNLLIKYCFKLANIQYW